VRLPRLTHPAQFVVLGFTTAVGVGTALLMTPLARRGPGSASWLDALFTSASAVCVTGLTTVDTTAHWSRFGQAVIIALIQVGGFGIMALATLLGLLVSKRLGLRSRLNAVAETNFQGLGEVGNILLAVARTSLLIEAAGALILTVRFALSYDEPWSRALWLGVFHAVSAFNNAGFALFSDNLIGFASDPFICVPVALMVIAGSLGFPVLFELRREWRRPHDWSLHTKLVTAMTAILLGAGTVMFTALEWTNDRTLGPLSAGGKALAAFFQSVMTRNAGFNSVSTGDLNPETLLGTDVLMFIGGGSAGTAGGIKVTTFAVLLFVIITEVRGDRDVNAFNRQIPRETQRQALSVALLAVAAVVGSSVLLLVLTPFSLEQVLFEVISALSTTGLSTGLTAAAGDAGQLVLLALMFIGRIGPITLASALALRSRPRLYDLPSERPIIG
jgi:trk system potassium uptake protein TrkH